MTKRTWWIAASIVIIALIMISAGAIISKAKRFGKTQYYTRVVQPGLVNGQAVWGYTYKQPAYDRDGNERRLEFLADKSLRLQAYLRIYVSGQDHVTAWEEVSADAVPVPAMEQLKLHAGQPAT